MSYCRYTQRGLTLVVMMTRPDLLSFRRQCRRLTNGTNYHLLGSPLQPFKLFNSVGFEKVASFQAASGPLQWTFSCGARLVVLLSCCLAATHTDSAYRVSVAPARQQERGNQLSLCRDTSGLFTATLHYLSGGGGVGGDKSSC